ncbi:MAG: sigma 54-interacting transcriptional regulator, partial [Bradymonadaceae bacterium]
MKREEDMSCTRCGLVPRATGLKHSPLLVARSPAMQEALRRASRFAHSDAPVVVFGETGSGKEVIARVLHQNSSRSQKSFVAINVAALPAELLESELFGHGKGAFTGAVSMRQGLFEEADGGTLFLDEIGEMPLTLQAKLLRVLQDGEVRRVGENRPFRVDVRIICATHRDLNEQIEAGLFREDLYFRLKVLTLRAPPLRE